MKLKEIKFFQESLKILFQFFEENNIQSSLDKIKDWKSLLNALLEGELIDYDYNLNVCHLALNFRTREPILDTQVAFYIYQNDEQQNHVMFDFQDQNNSTIQFGFYDLVYVPFLEYLKDVNNQINFSILGDQHSVIEKKGTAAIKFMSLNDFRTFLKQHNKTGKLIGVEVE